MLHRMQHRLCVTRMQNQCNIYLIHYKTQTPECHAQSPHQIGNLADCATLKARENALSSLPDRLFSGCVSLKHLDLGKNRLQTLSGAVAQLQSLRELMLQSNGMTALPEELGDCLSLKVLDVSDNALTRCLPLHMPCAVLWIVE
jgi:hypothetical protein